MALIQIVEFPQNLDVTDVFAWRFTDPSTPSNSDTLGNWTQLIVHESQEAILVRDGQALDLFGPGRYTLSTDNIPLLSSLLSLPTGGQSPFKASVWFINKLHVLDIKWGTTNPLQLKDPEFRIPVPVRAYGQFGVRIVDSRKFLLKLVGARSKLDRNDLISSFRGLILNRMGDLIASYLVKKKINIFEINAYLGAMADESAEQLKPYFEDYGIEILNFYLGSVNVPDDDPSIIEIRKALSERAHMEVIGYDYRQKRSFDTMEKLAGGSDSSQSLTGAGMGLGVGMGMGGAMGQLAAQMAQNLEISPSVPKHHCSCPFCGKSCKEGARFCSECGKPLLSTCPNCNSAVENGSKFCSHCGTSLQKICPCGAALQPDSVFCPNCGRKTGTN